MKIDNHHVECYRQTFPEDADRMSWAKLSAEKNGMTEEFNYLLESSLEIGVRANWSYLLAACGRITEHNYVSSCGRTQGSNLPIPSPL